jgi:hypothetical protein
MKRNNILLVIIAGILLAACTTVNQPEAPGRGDISIRLTVPSMLTKADRTDTEAERTVTSLDILVYDDVAAAPVWTSHIAVDDEQQLAGTYVQNTTPAALGLGEDKSALLTMTVFAVANYPTSLAETTMTLTEVKALAVDASAFVTGASESGVVLPDPRFIMVAEGGFTADGATTTVTADLALARLAAKVSLTLTYPDETITTQGPVYGSHPTTIAWAPLSGENLRVYLDNAAMSATLGGPASPVPAGFTYADTHPAAGVPEDFYTYPFAWDDNLDRAPFIKIIQPWHYVRYYTNGSGVDVVVDENVVELYYKVMFPGLTSLASNTWYNTTVMLNVLGGEAETPLVLEASGLDILGWGTATGIDPVDLKPVKYLVVDQNEVEVQGGKTVSIHYLASSRPNLTVNSVVKYVYQNADSTDVNIKANATSDHYDYEYDESTEEYISSPWFTNEYDDNTHEGFIVLHHSLSGDPYMRNGDPTPNFAARPYIYDLTLDLAEVPSQPITITQYPPLYVLGHLSTGWVSINEQDANNGYPALNSNSPVSTNYYTDGYQPRASKSYTKPYVLLPFTKKSGGNIDVRTLIYSSKSVNSVYSVNNLGTVSTYDYLASTGSNICRFRIIIRPTASEDYFIMDPRIDISADQSNELYEIINKHNTGNYNTVYNNQYDGSSLLPHGSTSTEYAKIKAYKPGGKDAKYKDYLSPEVMFASSYGKGTTINFMTAVLRCAAYQEDGFPAGRWRLPTEAEIELAISLANRGAIPELFADAGKYWASSGRYLYGGNWVSETDPYTGEPQNNPWTGDTNGTGVGVRCVYDTWYWGREEEKALMTNYNGKKTGGPSNTSQPQYIWSGYSYTSK